MVLYCVIKRVDSENEEDLPVVITLSQKEAYDYMKAKDPEKTKDLAIYPVEV